MSSNSSEEKIVGRPAMREFVAVEVFENDTEIAMNRPIPEKSENIADVVNNWVRRNGEAVITTLSAPAVEYRGLPDNKVARHTRMMVLYVIPRRPQNMEGIQNERAQALAEQRTAAAEAAGATGAGPGEPGAEPTPNPFSSRPANVELARRLQRKQRGSGGS